MQSETNNRSQSRRHFLGNLAIASGGLAMAGSQTVHASKNTTLLSRVADVDFGGSPRPTDDGTFTIAHVTDIHISTNDVQHSSAQRLRFAFEEVQRWKPSLVINTGDTIDGQGKSPEKMEHRQGQLAVYQAAIEKLQGIPVHTVLGNHDLDHGHTAAESSSDLGMPSPFYQFDHRGWRFLMIDSTRPGWNQAHWDWFVAQLDQTPKTMPILIAGHYPIFSAGGMVHYLSDHIDRWKEIIALFNHYPNVKLCISGHMHLAGLTQYNQVKYADGGAVSGHWWGLVKSEKSDGLGSYHQTPPGFNVIRLSATDVVSVDYHIYPDPFVEEARKQLNAKVPG